ncbi:MAG: hypothetical protein NZO16_07995 [Deltaproteobacteria bacterium]|nr:hypothetical protein [Deltaproteobacteria bacterium]
MGNPRFFEKVVLYEGEPVKLYSFDGQVWTSKKEELSKLQERLIKKKLEILGVRTDTARLETTKNESRSRKLKEVERVGRRAQRVRDITKAIVEIKAEELKTQILKSANQMLSHKQKKMKRKLRVVRGKTVRDRNKLSQGISQSVKQKNAK